MARSEWAKLHAKVNESEDFANVFAQSPEAATLFLLALPQAAPWGVLPGSAPLFAARVCPQLMLSRDQVQSSLRVLIDAGLFLAYEGSDSKPLLYVTGWNKHQTRQWERCGLPEFDLPPCWEPPAEIATGLVKAAKSKRGLTCEALCVRLQGEEAKTTLRLLCDRVPPEVRGERGEERDEKGRGGVPPVGDPPTAPAPVADADPTPASIPPDIAMRKQNEPCLRASLDRALEGRSQAKRRDDWFAELSQAMRDYPAECSEERLCHLLELDPPKAMDRFSDAWLRRVIPSLGKPPVDADGKRKPAGPTAEDEAKAAARRERDRQERVAASLDRAVKTTAARADLCADHSADFWRSEAEDEWPEWTGEIIARAEAQGLIYGDPIPAVERIRRLRPEVAGR